MDAPEKSQRSRLYAVIGSRHDEDPLWETEFREAWPYKPYRLKQVMTKPHSLVSFFDGRYKASSPRGRLTQVNSGLEAWDRAFAWAEEQDQIAREGMRRSAENLILWVRRTTPVSAGTNVRAEGPVTLTTETWKEQ